MKVLLPTFAVCVSVLTIALAGSSPVYAQKKTLVLKDGKAAIDATLSKTDPQDKKRDNHRYKAYSVQMKAEVTYQIDLKSKDFDPVLRLEAADGKELAQNDDGGDGFNARITFKCPETASYRIVCTEVGTAKMGKFNLSIQQK